MTPTHPIHTRTHGLLHPVYDIKFLARANRTFNSHSLLHFTTPLTHRPTARNTIQRRLFYLKNMQKTLEVL